MNSLNRFADTVYCLIRLIVGLMFACHGGQKLLGMFGGEGMAHGLMLVGGIIELVGGFLIALGFLARLAAFFSSGMMAVAYFMVHAAGKAIQHVPPTPTEAFFPILNKGEPAVLYCLFFLFIFFYGAGRLSIDAMISRDKAPVATP